MVPVCNDEGPAGEGVEEGTALGAVPSAILVRPKEPEAR